MEKLNSFNPDSLNINQILDSLTLEIRSNPRIWSSALLELTAVLATQNIEVEKLPAKEAAKIAQDVVIALSYHFGGRAIYLPAGDRLKKATQAIGEMGSENFNAHRDTFLKTVNDQESALWPSILLELYDVLIEFYKNRLGLDLKTAMRRVQEVIIAIAAHRGGRAIYLPRIDKIKQAIRDRAIFESFNGTNHVELSIRAKLTVTRIYSILHRERCSKQNLTNITMSNRHD